MKVLQVLVQLDRADVALELHRARQAGTGAVGIMEDSEEAGTAKDSLSHAHTVIDLRLRSVLFV